MFGDAIKTMMQVQRAGSRRTPGWCRFYSRRCGRRAPSACAACRRCSRCVRRTACPRFTRRCGRLSGPRAADDRRRGGGRRRRRGAARRDRVGRGGGGDDGARRDHDADGRVQAAAAARISRNSVIDCACAIMRAEGPRAFMISYPVTLGMYALVMGTSNELLRRRISDGRPRSRPTCSRGGSGLARRRRHQPARRDQDAAADAALPDAARRRRRHVPDADPSARTRVLRTCAAIWRGRGARLRARRAGARARPRADTDHWTTYEAGKHLLGKLGWRERRGA